MSAFQVGDYLLARLSELGIRHLFGVPGDYVLGFNAQIEATADMAWVANCNELNAAYAAEGYARTHGVGAFVVTAGVGDLGAASGVCGALAERSSVVVISGVPGASRPGATHHSAGDGDFGRFERILAEMTVAHTTVGADDAPAEIDRVLRACVIEHGPVFIALPADVTATEISPPAAPLDVNSGGDPQVVEQLQAAVAEQLAVAQRPIVLVDAGVRQARLGEAVARALAAGDVGWAVTGAAAPDVAGPAGPGYLGVYPGGYGHRSAREVDEADLLIRLGIRRVERPGPRAVEVLIDPMVVDVGFAQTTIGSHVFAVPMTAAVEAVSAALASAADRAGPRPGPAGAAGIGAGPPPGPAVTGAAGAPPPASEGPLTQDAFWAQFWDYLQPGDVVVTDPGSGFFPLVSGERPDGVTVHNQKTWLAIGWALPAALGAEMAAPDRRHIVVIGDGALALTVQELSTLAREGCAPLVVVVDNGGYLIEDLAIGGVHLDCDDIWVWDYPALAAAFDDRGRHHPLGLRASSAAELTEALKRAAEGQRDGRLVVLDAVFGRDDMPASMRALHLARLDPPAPAGVRAGEP